MPTPAGQEAVTRAPVRVISSPVRIVPGTTTLALMPARVEADADVGVDEAHGREAEALGELGAAPVRLIGDLHDRLADAQPGARRQLLGAEVEVDVQLVAGERPPLRRTGDQRHGPDVHDVELHVGMGRAVGRARAGPLVPRVADEADGQVELGDVEDLALAETRGGGRSAPAGRAPMGERAISAAPASSSSFGAVLHGAPSSSAPSGRTARVRSRRRADVGQDVHDRRRRRPLPRSHEEQHARCRPVRDG